jgi:hypothetical protein
MYHHGVDTDLLEQRNITAKPLGQMFIAHGMTAIFHHHGRTCVTAQEGQGLCQYMRLLRGGGDIDRVGMGFTHGARLGPRGCNGQANGDKRADGSDESGSTIEALENGAH